jgi:hypothetical protein
MTSSSYAHIPAAFGEIVNVINMKEWVMWTENHDEFLQKTYTDIVREILDNSLYTIPFTNPLYEMFSRYRSQAVKDVKSSWVQVLSQILNLKSPNLPVLPFSQRGQTLPPPTPVLPPPEPPVMGPPSTPVYPPPGPPAMQPPSTPVQEEPPATPNQDASLKTPQNSFTYKSEIPKTATVLTLPPLFSTIVPGSGLDVLQQVVKEVNSTPNKTPSPPGTATQRAIFPPETPTDTPSGNPSDSGETPSVADKLITAAEKEKQKEKARVQKVKNGSKKRESSPKPSKDNKKQKEEVPARGFYTDYEINLKGGRPESNGLVKNTLDIQTTDSLSITCGYGFPIIDKVPRGREGGTVTRKRCSWPVYFLRTESKDFNSCVQIKANLWGRVLEHAQLTEAIAMGRLPLHEFTLANASEENLVLWGELASKTVSRATLMAQLERPIRHQQTSDKDDEEEVTMDDDEFPE